MPSPKRRITALLVWVGLVATMAVPVLLAATSPYLAYRNLPYIVGGFAGIVCLALFVVQPLLAAGYLPGPGLVTERRWHRGVGVVIVLCVVLHVGGLYVTSPPDTMDALLLVAPTPFSVYGVLAMWTVLATAVLVALRRRSGLRYATWYLVHNALALVAVVATVIHALQIEGAMEIVSKWALCLAALFTTGVTLLNLRVIKPLVRWRGTRAGSTPE
jgi:predicted ferric reductase